MILVTSPERWRPRRGAGRPGVVLPAGLGAEGAEAASGIRAVDVDVPGEHQCVLGVGGLEGDATQQADPVQRDALASEYEDEGEERGPGVAVVEGMEEADVEMGAGGSGGQGRGCSPPAALSVRQASRRSRVPGPMP